MPEVNLLPSDLREKEEHELESSRKRSKRESVAFSKPLAPVSQPVLKTPRPSLLSRLFAKRIDGPRAPEAAKNMGSDTQVREIDRKPERDATLHLPKVAIPAPTARTEVADQKLAAEKSAVRAEAAVPSERGPVAAKPTIPEQKKESKKSHFTFWKKSKSAVRPARVDQAAAPGLDVNLIPAELAKAPDLELSKKLFSSGVVLFLTLLLIAGAYLGITWYQLNVTQQLGAMEVTIQDLNTQISGYEKNRDAALALQQRLKLVKQLLERHVYWTQFFTLLERYTVANVYYSNFSMVGQDSVVLSAVGKDFKSVAQQLTAFQSATDFIKDVRIDSATAAVDPKKGTYSGVNFNINIDFIPGIFLKPFN